MQRIRDMEQLDFLLEKLEQLDCFISLNGGIRSSKSIWKQEDGVYTILNEIDDSVVDLTKDELFDNQITLVGEAMKKGSLFLYDYELMQLTEDEKEEFLNLQNI